MKPLFTCSALVLAVCSLVILPRGFLAQACEDEDAMVESTSKELVDFVGVVQKEDLKKFEEAYHQRSCLTKLSFCLTLVDEAEECLEKAEQDPAVPEADKQTRKAEHERFAKFRKTVEEDQKVLKAAEKPADAKALIEKFDFAI